MAATDCPQILNSKDIFHGRVFDVTVDTIREHDKTYERETVHHPGSAVIVPIFDDGTIALVRQYRHPAVRYLLEVPAGTLKHGEVPEEGAARELEEELGVTAGNLEKLAEFFVTPGFCEEKMWLYLATELTASQQQLEDDEIIEIIRMPFNQALTMITSGEIEDAKTIIGVMLAAPRVGLSLFETSYPAV
ncbi:MAG TPA: NUDIX hydrolase [Pyrinomonadaceae bacterium]|nr:NUDIX hydrolase [Pyrinomonadaceae bacterium]